MRVAIYARVSTEEQVKHGISIDAQLAALHSWAASSGHEIVGEYVDEGISARKPPSKRPALQRLLTELPANHTELIAFTKLDRWTRNVKGYYQVQDVLDQNRTAWIAIHEDYETVTAAGRFKTNIMLAVSESEADRTSERIKAVFEHKINLGQPITSSLPIGYSISGKSVVPDDNAPIALAAFEHFAKHGNRNMVRSMLSDHGIKLSYPAVTNMLRNTMYIGEYHGNAQYCEPIIPRALFAQVQHDLENRSTRRTPSGRVYLFSGLIICGECGRKMGACYNKYGLQYYRCTTGHQLNHDCSNKHHIREEYIEHSALAALARIAAGKASKYTQQPKQKPINKAAIQKKLDRLKELYIEGDITKEKYRQQRNELTSKLAETNEKPNHIVDLIGSDYMREYDALDRAKKKNLWRLVIDRIEVSGNGSIDIFFIQ